MKNTDRYVSLAVLGLAGFWTYMTFQIRATALPGAPGPRFFPLLVIGLLALFSLMLFLSTFKKKPGPAQAPRPDATPADKIPAHLMPLTAGKNESAAAASPTAAATTAAAACEEIDEPDPIPRRMLYSFIAMFVYVVATDLVGFYVATVPFIIVVMKGIMKTKSWMHTLIGTAVITGVIYLIFTVLFKLSLPNGSLW